MGVRPMARAAALCLLLTGGSWFTALAEPVSVTAVNHSTPTTCAEVDNVYYTLSAPAISEFTVTASVPRYLDEIVKDHTAPDFSGCKDVNPPPPPLAAYQPPPTVIYEDDQVILRGIVDPRFWRPPHASVRVDTTVWHSFDLVQLFKKTPAGPIEFLVFYPQDGSWRLKGLPPMKLPDTSYGSSFLLGPVQRSTRPFVDYRKVVFDKHNLTFIITLAGGGTLTVTPTRLNVGSASLRVSFDPPLKGKRPFMALRSMFVSPGNADAAEVAFRERPNAAVRTVPIMGFRSGQVSDITFERTALSKHNVSAPDMRFKGFRAP